MRGGDLKVGAGGCAHVLELVAAQIAENRVRLGVAAVGSEQADVVQHIRTRDKQVLPPVIVEIHNAVAPP